MLDILQVPPFLAAEICELGMVITMLADSFLAQFGLSLALMCADFWQISQNYVTQDWKSTPHVSVQVNCGFLAYCASWLKVQISC